MKNSTLIPTLAVVRNVVVQRLFRRRKKKRGGAGVPVLVAQAVETNVPVQIDPPPVGHVTPYSDGDSASASRGIINQVHFKEGQEVKAAILLFTIDPRPTQAALARDKAQLENATAQFNRDQKTL